MIPTPTLVSCHDLKRGYQPRSPEEEQAQVARLTRYFEDGERQLVPIITYKGTVVDGHCRWLACMARKKKVLAVEWHGPNPPTEEEVRRINSSQAAIPAAIKAERVERALAKGRTIEQVAAEEGASVRHLKRKVANVAKVRAAGTLDLATASQGQVDAEAARLTKAKAGTKDAKGRTRKGGNRAPPRPAFQSATPPGRLESTPTTEPAEDPRDATIAQLRKDLAEARQDLQVQREVAADLKRRVRELERALRSAAEG